MKEVSRHKGYVIPEGAEKFLNLYRIQNGRHEFYKMVDGQIWYFDYDDKVWSKAKGKANYHKAEDLPKLPGQDLPNWDDAPEWADRLGYLHSLSEDLMWISMLHIQYAEGDQLGEIIENKVHMDKFDIKEMRPIAIEDKEWLPVVGEEFEFKYGLDHERNYWQKSKLVAITDRFFIYTQEDLVEEEVDGVKSVTFRPLKTKEDLFIEAARPCTENTLLDNDDPEVLAFITNLIDAGFTAPKGEG